MKPGRGAEAPTSPVAWPHLADINSIFGWGLWQLAMASGRLGYFTGVCARRTAKSDAFNG